MERTKVNNNHCLPYTPYIFVKVSAQAGYFVQTTTFSNH